MNQNKKLYIILLDMLDEDGKLLAGPFDTCQCMDCGSDSIEEKRE